MFKPITPPPTEHHNFTPGHSSEFGDSPKTVAEKINAGFAHVYATLKGLGASLADEVEYVAKSDFDDLAHELAETKAELANVKRMVQGLGFAGTKAPAITDPSHSMSVTPGRLVTAVAPEITVTVAEKEPETAAAPSDPTVMVIGNLDGAAK